MTPLERMARAYNPVGWGWYDQTAESDYGATKRTRDLFRTTALANMRAALAAIREPSEGMVEESWASALAENARDVWGDMIDAALKEG